MTRAFTIAALAGVVACGGTPGPAELDTAHETCASCRMVVSDRRLASQVVAAGEVPRFFDDLRCLREYLSAHPSKDAVVFVADHRTSEWIPASGAVFSRLARPTTPMASGLIAHASVSSRDLDASASGSTTVPSRDVFSGAAAGAPP